MVQDLCQTEGSQPAGMVPLLPVPQLQLNMAVHYSFNWPFSDTERQQREVLYRTGIWGQRSA